MGDFYYVILGSEGSFPADAGEVERLRKEGKAECVSGPQPSSLRARNWLSSWRVPTTKFKHFRLQPYLEGTGPFPEYKLPENV